MPIPGLVSVTFRDKGVGEILALCGRAALRSVEWGGDVHVPAGDAALAARVGEATRGLGLEARSYGSYFRLGDSDEAFERSLASCAALGAPVMRIWAGRKGSALVSGPERAARIRELNARALAASARGVALALEYHAGTLTDARESVIRLLGETEPAVRLYWQPRFELSERENLELLGDLGERLDSIHAFAGAYEGGEYARRPLAEAERLWRSVIEGPAGGADRRILLEFVAGDSEESLMRDAETLLRWCGGASGQRRARRGSGPRGRREGI